MSKALTSSLAGTKDFLNINLFSEIMKNTTLTFQVELTPSQVIQWNELVSRIKDTVLEGPKIGFRDYKKPPREFSEKILELPVLKVPKESRTDVQLFESLEVPTWVGPLELMEILLKEKKR